MNLLKHPIAEWSPYLSQEAAVDYPPMTVRLVEATSLLMISLEWATAFPHGFCLDCS